MNRIAPMVRKALFCVLALTAGWSHAWDGIAVGQISEVNITVGGNAGLRISLAGVNSMCAGGPNWAYLNDTDSNYRLYAAAFLAAQAGGRQIVVYSSSVNGFCAIGFLTVR